MLRLSYLGSHFNMCIRKCLHTWRCITNDIRNHFFFQIPSWYILVSEETHFKGPHCESSEKQVGGASPSWSLLFFSLSESPVRSTYTSTRYPLYVMTKKTSVMAFLHNGVNQNEEL